MVQSSLKSTYPPHPCPMSPHPPAMCWLPVVLLRANPGNDTNQAMLTPPKRMILNDTIACLVLPARLFVGCPMCQSICSNHDVGVNLSLDKRDLLIYILSPHFDQQSCNLETLRTMCLKLLAHKDNFAKPTGAPICFLRHLYLLESKPPSVCLI